MNEEIHKVGHKYKPTIIVPMIAIENNWQFLVNGSVREIMTADGFHCEVLKCNIVHICDLEEEIKKIYNIDAWSFIKTWHKYDRDIDNMHFIRLELKIKK